MNREEYIDLFHRAEVNLVAFKQVNDCGEELRKMVEMAVKAEREACAKVCDAFQARDVGMQPAECAGAIRARGQT
jgi:cell fate (sporulation/competence/biofilm development) regulator YmcA (YheA/YmcA/DUF963 family)